jgi:threonine dehydrogenase-like Zn-dependent dehydrogenase
MRAVTWQGKHDIQVKDVPDPRIQDPRDIILRVTTTAICGPDLHIYDGYIPTMKEDDILGHEFMGVVEEAGSSHPLKKGDCVRSRSHVAPAIFASGWKLLCVAH